MDPIADFDNPLRKEPAPSRSEAKPPKIMATLAAIGHILDKEGGRLLALGVKFVVDRDIALRMHHAVRDAFDTIVTEAAVKRIIIDSKEWPSHSVKFYDTPDMPPSLQIQEATIRNVIVSRVEKENSSERVIRFDVVAPASACGEWPQKHYRADIWFTFANQQGALFEEAA